MTILLVIDYFIVNLWTLNQNYNDMVSIIIGSLAVVFGFIFLRGSQKRNTKPSVTRVIIYFLMTLIVGVFFYKTNRVIEISKLVQIDPKRASFLKSSNEQDAIIVDTIKEIVISNTFGSENYTSKYKLDRKSKHDNIYLEIFSPQIIDYEIQDYVSKEMRMAYEDKLKVARDKSGRIYEVICSSSTIPRIFPFYIKKEKEEKPKFDDKAQSVELETNIQYYREEHPFNFDDLPDNAILNGYNKDEIATEYVKHINKNMKLIGQSKYSINQPLRYHGEIKESIMDFFTAADISQYSLSLALISKCPIKKLRIEYDIPIETNISSNDGNSIGSSAIELYEGVINTNDLKSGIPLYFHIKLPSMANLQMIRNLILTTLITALLTLLLTGLSDLYIYRRKELINMLERMLHKSKSKQKTNTYNKIYYTIKYLTVLIISVAVIYFCYRIYYDEPIYLEEQEAELLQIRIKVISLIFVLSFLVSYVMMRLKVEKEKLKKYVVSVPQEDADKFHDIVEAMDWEETEYIK